MYNVTYNYTIIVLGINLLNLTVIKFVTIIIVKYFWVNFVTLQLRHRFKTQIKKV
jgi:hypothetical protein